MDFNLCKNCSFYTGIQCHGHGDFWGTCNVIIELPNRNIWDSVVYDDTQCKVLRKELIDFCYIEIKKLKNTISQFEEMVKKYGEKDK